MEVGDKRVVIFCGVFVCFVNLLCGGWKGRKKMPRINKGENEVFEQEIITAML
jgi:hypothetical protein